MPPAVGSMLNLFSLKNKERDSDGHGPDKHKKKASAAQLRITKDINELELPKTCRTEFPDPDDLLQVGDPSGVCSTSGLL